MEQKNLKLVPLAENIFILKGPNNIGVIIDEPCLSETGKQIWLIDSGGGSEYAAQIIKALDLFFCDASSVYSIRTVIVTHGHSDHFGGCSWLKEKFNCRIIASEGEKAAMENPFIEPSITWGGFPLPELRTAYFEAVPCKPTDTITASKKIQLHNGTKISFIPLPGHHFNMFGILCTAPDGKRILYAGDAIFGRNHLGKYWTPFLFDVGKFKESLKQICKIKADYYVPGHGDEVSDILPLYELNMLSVLSAENKIIEILKTPMTAEELLKEFADESNICLALGQYVLIGCTIRSYLSYLYKSARIKYFIKDNRMYWMKSTI